MTKETLLYTQTFLQREMLKCVNMATTSLPKGLSKGLVPKTGHPAPRQQKTAGVSLESDLFNTPLERQMPC